MCISIFVSNTEICFCFVFVFALPNHRPTCQTGVPAQSDHGMLQSACRTLSIYEVIVHRVGNFRTVVKDVKPVIGPAGAVAEEKTTAVAREQNGTEMLVLS
jgi:hypothetical protein